jgi:hypothetical protein
MTGLRYFISNLKELTGLKDSLVLNQGQIIIHIYTKLVIAGFHLSKYQM